jgi:aminoglycoside phosphotransferase (APT) family kinase protein
VLDVADVAGYLLRRKLLSPRAVVDGGLLVVDASRLNRVFLVTAQCGPSYVVKLAGAAGDAGVAHEAAVLSRLRSDPLAAHLPNVVSYDATDRVLVLEAAPGARDLVRHHRRGRFSVALAREAGRALAQLHATPRGALDGIPSPPHPTTNTPVHRLDLDTMRTLSAAAVELIRILQSFDDLCAALDGVQASWREDSLVHGDVRWDNCIVWRRPDADRWTQLQLIDWELAGVGDPGIDVGSFLAEYLLAWVQSVPISDPQDPGRLLPYAGLPLRRMRPAVRAFWQAYARRRGSSVAELHATLQRSMHYTGVRLLGAALEEAQVLSELQASVLSLLSLSHNIVCRPRDAADLLGLPDAWATAS